jgi:hypothetical protein
MREPWRARIERDHREQRNGHAWQATGRPSERSLASPGGDASRGYHSKRDTHHPHGQNRAEHRHVFSPIRAVAVIPSLRALQSKGLACDGDMDQ